MNTRMLLPGVFLLMAACSDTTGLVMPVLPHNPVNEGWKAVENFEYSYDTMDLTLLDQTLSNEFVFVLDETDWDDLNGDGIIDTLLTRDLFMPSAVSLFNTAETVNVILDGNGESEWSGDSTGQSMQYPRSYTILINPDSVGDSYSSSFIFICSPDSGNGWVITHIFEDKE